MASFAIPDPPQIHRFPQSKYIDAVRWLPPISAFDRFAAISLFDVDSDSSSIEIHSLVANPPKLSPHSTWNLPSRASSLKTSQTHQNPLIVASTSAGSVHFLIADPIDASIGSELSVPENVLHAGPVSCVDLRDGGVDCVSVGEDGRVNLVGVGEDGRLNHRQVFYSNGLVSYTAAKWASPTEFVTGGYGFSLQWWDQRNPGGAVSQFKGNWAKVASSGIVHSIDIHPSRKHTCLAGGSLGSVFAWDLRLPNQPIILSGVGKGELATPSPCESEVWEVQYDRYTKPTNISSISSSHILPAIACSEDGILTIVEQGEEPVELLAEPCAINSFDIDQQYPSDVICSLEWESIAIVTRP